MLDLAISYGVTVVSEVRDKVFASDHMAVETTIIMRYGLSPRATRCKVYLQLQGC